MSDTRDPHFIIPKREDFTEKSFALSLTKESKEAFELGRPGQGYIGLVDLTNGNIHLIPSFNKNDGLLRLDKNGEPFKLSAESFTELGTMTGDLHGQCVSKLGLVEKAGQNGQIMGFGFWKGGTCLKVLSEIPNTPALIPEEFLLVKNTREKKTEEDKKDESKSPIDETADAGWELYCTCKGIEGESVQIHRLPLNTEIRQLLAEVKDPTALNNISKLKPEDRKNILELRSKLEKEIENLARKHYEASKIFLLNQVSRIKYLKNRSSSQNVSAVKYSELYRDYYRLRSRNYYGSKTKTHLAHLLSLTRELPYDVLFKIMSVTNKALNIHQRPLANLADGIYGIRSHLEYLEKDWMDDPTGCLRDLFNELAQQKDGFDEINHLIKKHKDIDWDSILIDNIVNAFISSDAVRFNFFLRFIDLEKNREAIIHLLEQCSISFALTSKTDKQELFSPVAEEKQAEKQIRLEFLKLFSTLGIGFFKTKNNDIEGLLPKISLIELNRTFEKIPAQESKETNELAGITRDEFLKIVLDFGTDEQKEWATEMKSQQSPKLTP